MDLGPLGARVLGAAASARLQGRSAPFALTLSIAGGIALAESAGPDRSPPRVGRRSVGRARPDGAARISRHGEPLQTAGDFAGVTSAEGGRPRIQSMPAKPRPPCRSDTLSFCRRRLADRTAPRRPRHEIARRNSRTPGPRLSTMTRLSPATGRTGPLAAPAGSDPLRQRTELACRAAPRPRQVTSQESPLDLPRPPPSCAGTLPCLTKSRRQAEPAAPSGRAGPRSTTKSGHTCSAASPGEVAPTPSTPFTPLASRPWKTAPAGPARIPMFSKRRLRPTASLRLSRRTRRSRRASSPTAPSWNVFLRPHVFGGTELPVRRPRLRQPARAS